MSLRRLRVLASVVACVWMPVAYAQSVPATPPATAAALANLSLAAGLELQILLERAHFSPGELDGNPGANTRRALMGYQAYKGLPVTGEADAATRQALAAEGAPLFTQYVITQADIDYPYTRIPAGFMAQAKLKALSFTTIQENIGERFHSSPALLKTLNPGADWSKAGTVLKVPNVEVLPPLAKADSVLVDESDKTLQLLDAAGVAYAQFPITSGTAKFPLPVGDWKITGIAADPWYNYNPALISTSRKGDRKTRLPPGPNGPVGTMWIGLTKPHYGIHGTPNPHLIGRTQSNGCVRLTNWSAHLVASAVAPGMLVRMQQ